MIFYPLKILFNARPCLCMFCLIIRLFALFAKQISVICNIANPKAKEAAKIIPKTCPSVKFIVLSPLLSYAALKRYRLAYYSNVFAIASA